MKKTTLLILFMTVLISLLSACAVPASVTIDAAATESAVSHSPAPAQTSAAPSGFAAVSEEIPSIAEDTKTYLLNGQYEKPEADKLHWTQEFLDQADIDTVYKDYLAGGGKAGDVLSFAEYLTDNAPIPENWKELFEANLKSEYSVTPSRYEALEDGFYQVFTVDEEGNEISYVAVNPRTGYFHG